MDDETKISSNVLDLTTKLNERKKILETVDDVDTSSAPEDFQRALISELSQRLQTPEERERLTVILLLRVWERWPARVTAQELEGCRELLTQLNGLGCKVYDSMLKLVDFMEKNNSATQNPMNLVGSLFSSLIFKPGTLYDPSKDQELLLYMSEPLTKRVHLILQGSTLFVLMNYGK
jgi:hypothetical protein